MIAYLQGEIKQIWSNSCLVLTSGGVGYRVVLPAHTMRNLPPVGAQAAFYTYMNVREDAIELFGFDTFAERQTFEALKSVNKVGPRMAMSILSTFRPNELQEIVLQDNVAALKKVSGIGQKTAQHILLELRYKLGSAGGVDRLASGDGAGIFTDLVAALLNLGYSEQESGEVARAIAKAEPGIDLASAIRLALKQLTRIK